MLLSGSHHSAVSAGVPLVLWAVGQLSAIVTHTYLCEVVHVTGFFLNLSAFDGSPANVITLPLFRGQCYF